MFPQQGNPNSNSLIKIPLSSALLGLAGRCERAGFCGRAGRKWLSFKNRLTSGLLELQPQAALILAARSKELQEHVTLLILSAIKYGENANLGRFCADLKPVERLTKGEMPQA